jgi:phosphoglycolate phosphatase-like HAD superfamily hydrolase
MTMGAGKNALEEVFRDTFAISKPNLSIDFGGRTDRSIARELFLLNGIEQSDKNFQFLFNGYIEILGEHLKQSSGYILPGINAILEILSEDVKVDLGLITGNIEIGAYRKLERFGIDSFFAFGGFGDRQEMRSGIAKEALAAAIEATSVSYEGSQIIVIGDTPHDVECSRAINARSIAVSTGYASKEAIASAQPDVIFDDLSDVDKVLSFIYS